MNATLRQGMQRGIIHYDSMIPVYQSIYVSIYPSFMKFLLSKDDTELVPAGKALLPGKQHRRSFCSGENGHWISVIDICLICIYLSRKLEDKKMRKCKFCIVDSMKKCLHGLPG